MNAQKGAVCPAPQSGCSLLRKWFQVRRFCPGVASGLSCAVRYYLAPGKERLQTVARSSEPRALGDMCGFDKVKGPRNLMRKGIALIFLGHINFIVGAIVHGTVLRHISKPEGKVTAEYSVANIICVISGLLSILTGIIAILVSRNVTKIKLDTTLALWIPSMMMSAIEAILSIRCLIVSMILRGIGPCGQNDVIDRIAEENPAKGKKSQELETHKLIRKSRDIQV
ncbi:keratinocyte-associated protein 3-like isoform X2 [Chiloscyllium plagiosum]|uniref:keratinocyte-associated protein 3-like isoform X2 n=1 Tax=Chiloscyllium plagiosum TaxID=36176 RepID=UPI001CB808A0|nr:keratinocyte-associated protein 3-like isoform X2 [Chiloscyllium plagiosum]